MTTPTPWLISQVHNAGAAPGIIQENAQIIGLANSKYLVAWEESGSIGASAGANGWDIVGRIYDGGGALIRDDFRLNSGWSVHDERDFAIQAMSDGGFAIVYMDVNQPSLDSAIRWERMDENGDRIQRTTIASEANATRLSNPQITVDLTSGESFVTFTEQSLTGNLDVRGVVLSVTGAVITGEFEAADDSTFGTRDQSTEDVARFGQQFYASAYIDNGDLRLSVVDDDGDLHDTITVDHTSTPRDASIAYLGLGASFDPHESVVVTWTDNADDVKFAIYGYDRLTTSGFLNQDPDLKQLKPHTFVDASDAGGSQVVALNAGGFVILWDQTDADNHRLYGQRYDRDGEAVGSRFTVTSGGDISDIDASLTADGRILVSWDDGANVTRSAIWDPRELDALPDTALPTDTFWAPIGGTSRFGLTDENSHLFGTSGAEILEVRGRDDVVDGKAGNDVIRYNVDDTDPGRDTVIGGLGRDTLELITRSDVGPIDFAAAGMAFSGLEVIDLGPAENATFTARQITQGFAADLLIDGWQASTMTIEMRRETFLDASDFEASGPPSNARWLIFEGDNSHERFVASVIVEEINGSGGNDVFVVNSPAHGFRDKYVGLAGTDILAIAGQGTFDFATFDDLLDIDVILFDAPGISDVQIDTANTKLFDGRPIRVDGYIGDPKDINGIEVIQLAGHSDLSLQHWTFEKWNDRGDEWVTIRLNTNPGEVDGSDVADSITAWNSNDTIRGHAGDDWIKSSWGEDSIVGGVGDDTILGDADDDTLLGGFGDDSILGGWQNDSIAGEGGRDRLFGEGGDDTLLGGDDPDHLDGGDDDDSLVGGEGSDTLVDGRGRDILKGEVGDDRLFAVMDAHGLDLFDGGLGKDTADFSLSQTAITLLSDQTVTQRTTAASTSEVELVEIEELVGTDHSDEFASLSGLDRITGGRGNDSFFIHYVGHRPEDIYLDGGDDRDRVILEAHEGIRIDLATGENGIGYWHLANIEDATGGNGNDTLRGDEGDNRLRGDFFHTAAGDDLLVGLGGDDDLEGSRGDDTLDGGTGADWMDGGDGDDWLTYENASGRISVSLTTTFGTFGEADGDRVFDFENVQGSAFNDLITGSSGDDYLVGGVGHDSLRGSAGADTLEGGIGRDDIHGGSGLDWAAFETAGARVIVSLTTETGTAGNANGDTYTAIENLLGSKHDDILTGSSDDNVIHGGRGHDSLRGSAGSDTLEGGIGQDDIHGGSGEDWASFTTAGSGVIVSLTIGVGSRGNANGDVYTSIEHLLGSRHDDILTGTSDANKIVGGLGDDSLRGSGGDDLLTGGAGADDIHGGSGQDTVSFEDATGGVGANLGSGNGFSGEAAGDTYRFVEHILGGAFDDQLTGASDDNALSGGSGDDFISGQAGADTLTGGAGNDTLLGGTGADQFVFEASLDAAGNVDALSDFDVAADAILLDAAIFGVLGSTVSASEFTIGSAATTASIHLIYNDATGALSYDVDGLGGLAAIQFAELSQGLALSHSDFQIV